MRALGYFNQANELNERLYTASKDGFQFVSGLAEGSIGAARIEADRGEFMHAKRHLARSREVLEKQLKDAPTSLSFLIDLSKTRYFMGKLLHDMGERDLALAEFIEGREVQRKVMAMGPDRASLFNGWFDLEIARLSAQIGQPERVKKDAGGQDDLDVDFPKISPEAATATGRPPGP